MDFKDFLMKEYKLGKKSADDYASRFNGILERGIYKGESQITPSMEATIEKEFEKSSGHYILALRRHIEFQQKNFTK
ncbi:hypothetical protein [Psychrobacillus lasiicapitis]|uniref:Uncharacterized protein n=1 Tax=Psychrobacillus lasiicapitis TaxID=1636719 RepID=A0A544T1V8_9BACI|nr:hypothetical protein [Psychrobacillus lasiicapitis]TQR11421.1 hypothetical protein FG382_15865 [Psychrobacillus lasiicapitis]GGA40690.1 hypothetical protein GCM10011384_32930 [Psychrobacillus lasiicapitis]